MPGRVQQSRDTLVCARAFWEAGVFAPDGAAGAGWGEPGSVAGFAAASCLSKGVSKAKGAYCMYMYRTVLYSRLHSLHRQHGALRVQLRTLRV